MLKNYLKTALRSLLKSKGFSIINIVGLGIGIACFVLIAVYVYHEVSIDRYHTKGDRIYRIVENLRTDNELLLQSTSSPPMGPTLAQQMPEVKNYVRFQQNGMLARKGDMAIYEENVFYADSSLFDVFDFPLVKGNPKTALVEPYTIVITESTAKKYFGNDDAFQQTLDLNGHQYKITGIAADVPERSHFTFDMLVSFNTWRVDYKPYEMKEWYWNGFHTYLLLAEGAGQIESLRSKMPAFIDKNIPKGGMHYESLPLQPLSSIYLETPRSWENGKRGNMSNLYTLSIIALFIVLIAAFNYVNLATARASRRLKEVGLRKVLGAQRRALVSQFLSEAFLVSLLATVLGFVLAQLAMPAFNTLVEAELGFYILPQPWYMWVAMASTALVLGALSGAYPALIISGFQPLQMFRGAPQSAFGHAGIRKMLVSIQFVISITLVAGTLLVFDQLQLLRNRDLGFSKAATLLIRYNGDAAVRDHLDFVKDEIAKVRGVEAVTASNTVPGQGVNNLFATVEMQDGKSTQTNINANWVDRDFFTTYDIPFIAGHNFTTDAGKDDTTTYFVMNETAVKAFGMTPDQAVGKKVRQMQNGVVIGVVKDFHYESLHHRVQPILLSTNYWGYNTLSVKVGTADMRTTVDAIGKAWKSASNNLPFRYSFLDDDYDRLYKADAQLGKVAGLFSGLALFVGCLGLLGLTSFAVERRVKEIGIRKVLGASVPQMVVLIAKEFATLIGVSFVISIPITYLLIGRWLENFIDKITITPIDFVLAGIVVLLLAGLTISYLAARAATANPVKALRNE